MTSLPRPLLLCILDGWGHRDAIDDNAIVSAHTPCWDRMWREFPHSTLETSGLAVGLPEGQMGNSEVGHMNIGSGRVVMQDLPRIDQAIVDGSVAAHPLIGKTIETLRRTGRTLHLMGLLSDGGVHAHQAHLFALIRIFSEAGVKVALHGFLDGRDTPPKSAETYVLQAEQCLHGFPHATFATLSGRYYAMDRDHRWDRVARAYQAIASAEAPRAESALQAVRASYAQALTDEFVVPVVLGEYAGMQEGDALLMANFRADRARELLTAFCDPAFSDFSRSRTVSFSHRIGMVEYSTALNAWMDTLFAPESLTDILGEILAARGLTQLRIAETEKYAHVTFFFNGGREEPFAGEERILVPSPKVATYDLQPEMSAFELTDRLVEAIASQRFDVIVVNYANTDMVGHTGDLSAARKAVEAVDHSLQRLLTALSDAGGLMLITADHGNAECMRDPDTGEPHTAHTTGPVPCLLVGNGATEYRLRSGKLADIAPTLLALLQIPQPRAMTGASLLV